MTNIKPPSVRLEPLVKIVGNKSYLCLLNNPKNPEELIIAKFEIQETSHMEGFGKPMVTFQSTISAILERGTTVYLAKDTTGRQVRDTSLSGLVAMIFL
jgi:hypothetical protein